MKLRHLYSVETRVGTFYISESADGRYHPFFDGESLGGYPSASAAAEDLAGGHTFAVSGIADLSSLGIPRDLSDWNQVPR